MILYRGLQEESPEGVLVRPATVDDLGSIARIFAHYARTSPITFEEEPLPEAAWMSRYEALSSRGLPFLAVDAGGTLVGYACAGPWRPQPAYRHTVEDSIYLAPGWTGRGLGRALLRALLAGCVEAGARQVIAVIADIGDAGAASLRLHRGCGFTDAGRLRAVGRKHGRWIDTLLLQRDLWPGRR